MNGFDRAFPLNYNDVDYCLRVRAAGKRIVYTPYAVLVHYESVSKSGTFSKELEVFKRRWISFVQDPFYNPNLSSTYGDFRINPDSQ